MKLLKSLAVAAGLALTTVAAPAALAQSSLIAVVDTDRVVAESSAGKSVASGIQNVARQMEAELKPENDSMNAEWQAIRSSLLATNPGLKQRMDALDKQLAGAQRIERQQAEQAQQNDAEFQRLVAEEANKNPTMRSRLEAFGNRFQAQQVRQRRAQVEMQATIQKGNQDLSNAVLAASQDAMTARGAVIVLQKDSTMANAAAIDITGDIISRMNARTPTVAVVRQRIPQQ